MHMHLPFLNFPGEVFGLETIQGIDVDPNVLDSNVGKVLTESGEYVAQEDYPEYLRNQ